MKEVIKGEELRKVMKTSVDLLCDTVATTLGPTGNNVLVNNSDTTPFITNDGVTIAENISSNDPKINTILEIVKEASLKTNELVGDGTTTTLVLLKSVFNLGLEEINSGVNPIILKNKLTNALNEVLALIDKEKKLPNNKDYEKVAYTSANDLEIANITSTLFSKMKSKYAIKLEESPTEFTYHTINKGYNVEVRNISSLYFKNNKKIELNDINVLVLKGYLNSLEDISEIINEGLSDKNILIFVEEMNESIKEELLVYYLTNNKNIFIVELEEYASHREKIEEDISILSDSIIRNIEFEKTSITDLGYLKNIRLEQDNIILSVDANSSNQLIKQLKNELKTTYNDYEKEFIASRLSKLEEGVATIYVGGVTKTEKRERKMRFEDALCALEVSSTGIVTGEGLTYLKVSENIDDKILKKSLEKPFETIMENLGLDSSVMKKEIIKSNYQKIYDTLTSSFIETKNSNIIDSLEVVKTSLKNAVSIASLLLTTSSLVINENEELVKNIM